MHNLSEALNLDDSDQRQFTAAEIDELVKGDTIVVAACPSQRMPPLHGKFVMKESNGAAVYCFCPFKKGVKVDFRPANEWVHGNSKDAASGIAEALIAGKKALRG